VFASPDFKSDEHAFCGTDCQTDYLAVRCTIRTADDLSNSHPVCKPNGSTHGRAVGGALYKPIYGTLVHPDRYSFVRTVGRAIRTADDLSNSHPVCEPNGSTYGRAVGDTLCKPDRSTLVHPNRYSFVRTVGRAIRTADDLSNSRPVCEPNGSTYGRAVSGTLSKPDRSTLGWPNRYSFSCTISRAICTADSVSNIVTHDIDHHNGHYNDRHFDHHHHRLPWAPLGAGV
jgi:hypothetical protein